MKKKTRKTKVKLYPHQVEALSEVIKNPHYALFMKPGTGKTLVAIKAIEYRYLKGEINRVVVFAPKTLLYNWELEINKFLEIPPELVVVERLNYSNKVKQLTKFNEFIKNDLSFHTLKELRAQGYTGTKRDILKNHKPKLLILLVNYEKSRTMFKELMSFKPHKLVVDESHKVRNRVQRSNGVYKVSRCSKNRLIMTGTPICKGYEDLFMQYKIMDSDILGNSYTEFESEFVVKGGYMNYSIVGYKNEDKLKKIIEETSYRIRLEDCVDLPKLTKEYRTCDLNSKARKAYEEINKDMFTTIGNSDTSRKTLKALCREYGLPYTYNESYTSLLLKTSNYLNTSSCEIILTKMMRMQQITGGFLTLDSGEVINISKDKLEVLKEIVEDSTKPVVVFCQYIPEINMIIEELSTMKRSGKYLRVKGFRDPKTRDLVYKEFREGKLDVIVLQLSSGSVGLNLQISDTLVMYSWNYSADDYEQAIDRIKRIDQDSPMKIIHIIAEDTLDKPILDVIEYKMKLAEKLMG